MAFNGTLVKVGTYTIPLKYIRYETYQATYSTIDYDSYRDANGLLHRNPLKDHKIVKVEFNTPYMSSSDMEILMNGIRSNYISGTDSDDNAYDKSVNLHAYIPETNSYVDAVCYVPDITYTIRNIDGTTLNYDETRIAFIGY